MQCPIIESVFAGVGILLMLSISILFICLAINILRSFR